MTTDVGINVAAGIDGISNDFICDASGDGQQPNPGATAPTLTQ